MNPTRERRLDGFRARLGRELGRLRYRLLAVNLFLVLVPAAGLEFARVYERQLLDALERDMVNQAALVRSMLSDSLSRGEPLDAEHHARILTDAARTTRTRIRLIDPARGVVADSHRAGPPEGREPAPPPLAPHVVTGREVRAALAELGDVDVPRQPEPIQARREIQQALRGQRAATTRVTRSAVFLFLAEPIEAGEKGVVYVTRSTNPVLVELHRIRKGLLIVLAVAIVFGAALTLVLAVTISRPLERLSGAARRIAGGETGVHVPLEGGGEIAELATAFRDMTQKLEARHRFISDFAADVAHEFKSPLTSIRGAAELLADGADDDPAARERFLKNIQLDATRLDRLVSRLLELSRIEASEELPQVIPLRALIQRVVDRCQTPDGALELRYRATVHAIRARESDLETALLNLLDNALRFSPAGGKIVIAVEDVGRDRVALSVSDSGPGIDPVNLDRVFDRFFTTDLERDGTGLGLAIVKTVCLAHGGEARVESELGKGARFTLELPIGLPRRNTTQ